MSEIISNYFLVCPQLSMPKLEPNCHLRPGKTDANGCATIGDIVCNESCSFLYDFWRPKLAPNCHLGPDKKDENGCWIFGDIICNESCKLDVVLPSFCFGCEIC